ncbi:hypothetical protein LQZ24_01945 [Fructobacillus sp. M1-13]|uniref:Uncharacterized protein n=1 Tax=Fructobacillus papyriferae TaxID=2713171 RepID=A0ABS5QQX0_9LACO|nr:hypothetical protein [Fructobacillus papyriferae]MBS9334801.1 hypothetical protein [Fructobacillus papyriferae]MCD2158791.1 hypothetical protein [Fructobacillus papyriferae]
MSASTLLLLLIAFLSIKRKKEYQQKPGLTLLLAGFCLVTTITETVSSIQLCLQEHTWHFLTDPLLTIPTLVLQFALAAWLIYKVATRQKEL